MDWSYISPVVIRGIPKSNRIPLRVFYRTLTYPKFICSKFVLEDRTFGRKFIGLH